MTEEIPPRGGDVPFVAPAREVLVAQPAHPTPPAIRAPIRAPIHVLAARANQSTSTGVLFIVGNPLHVNL